MESISDPELAALTPPAITGFNVTVSGARVGAPVPKTISTGPYTGLFGLNQQIDVTVHADDPQANRADAIVSVNAQSIPLFQFGVFYEGDLEIHNGPPMTFAGWVHTNGNLYLSSDNTFFQDLITTPQSVYWDRKAYADRRNGVWINNAAAAPVQLTFDSRSQPTSNGFKAASQASFDGRLMSSAHGVTPLKLPLPAGMPAVELIQPQSAADAPDVRKVKEAWLADMYVKVDLNQLATACNGITYLPRPGGRRTPDVAACPLIFSGKANTFLEGREDIGVDMLNVDVGALQDWIAVNHPGRRVDILYITFTNFNAGSPPRTIPRYASSTARRSSIRSRSPPIARSTCRATTTRSGGAVRHPGRCGHVPLRRMGRRGAHRLPRRADGDERRDVGFRRDRGGSLGDAVRLSGWRVPRESVRRRSRELPPLPRDVERRPDALSRLAGVALQQPSGEPPRLVVAPLLRPAVT